jgi:hypothetical protein
LGGFAVLAIALIGFFAFWPPSVQNDNATGAIGTVKKHNAPQISSSDVVLSDEATRLQEKILYVDFIDDAQKLKSFSDALASRENLGSVESQLAAHFADLQNRYNGSFTDALENLKAIESREMANRNAGNREALEALSQDFHNRTQGNRSLGHADMDALNQRFNDLANRILGTRDLASREADLAAIESQLESIRSEMQSREMQSREMQSREMQSREMQSREMQSREMQSREMQNRADMASRELAAIQQQLGVFDQLEAIRELQSRQDYLGVISKESRIVGEARENIANRADLGSFADALASEANNLENRAINNMDARFQNRVDYANRIDQMNRSLESIRSLGTRENLGDRADMFNRSLGSLRNDLQSREADLANRVNTASRTELQALDQLLSRGQANRDQVENRNLGNRDQMENRNLGNRDQMENRNLGNRDQVENRNLGNRDQMENRNLGNRDQMESRTLGNAERYLDNVSRNLGAFDQIANRDQIESRVTDMASRVDLASRSTESRSIGSRENN